MPTNSTCGSSPLFRIKRPPITTNGFGPDVDATIKSHLDELNQLLGKRIFKRDAHAESAGHDDKTKKNVEGHTDRSAGIPRFMPEIKPLLLKALTPKHIPEKNWAEESLLGEFHKHKEFDLSLSDCVDMTPALSALKYALQANVSFDSDKNTKTVLDGYPAIKDYLIAYAFHVLDLQDVNGLKYFILNNGHGAKNVANYAIVSAAREIIDKEQLEVRDDDKDDSDIVKRIKSAGLLLSSISFKPGVQAVIDDYVFNSDESKLIDDEVKDLGMDPLSPELKSQLVQRIKRFRVPISKKNSKQFLPGFISELLGQMEIAEPTEVDIAESDKDFEVKFPIDDKSLIQINVSAIKCASQLYYGMIMGDELDIFSVVNYFTHKYLVRGGINITDSRLRNDLQLYVFSNKFTDLSTNKIVDNTRPAERQMFYRQVFNYGRGQITDDVIVNTEFTKLWKVLILESAKYLERAQAAFHPENYVPRQNVMQAVEDIRYNLSTHCTGMANVITPLIYAELNFVIKQIFMHREIRQQIVPAGGTWWKVVETLYMGMKNTRPKATVLFNKAKLGHEIIRSMAEYDPTAFEKDESFSNFISNVDAYITTQSILQEALVDDLRKPEEHEEEEAPPRQNGSRRMEPEAEESPVASAARGNGNEWDF